MKRKTKSIFNLKIQTHKKQVFRTNSETMFKSLTIKFNKVTPGERNEENQQDPDPSNQNQQPLRQV